MQINWTNSLAKPWLLAEATPTFILKTPLTEAF
jgi:hypothetical protein